MKRNLKICYIIIILILLLGSLNGNEWRFELVFHNGVRTTFSTLIAGTDSAGGDYFDPDMDVPTFLPPLGSYAYFPLDDPSVPHITMLGMDIRAANETEITWVIFYGGDASERSRAVTWIDSLIPAYETSLFYLGAAYPGTEISEWIELSIIDTFLFEPAQYVAFRYVDDPGRYSEPPIVIDYQPRGEGILPDRNIEFIIYDEIEGVDESSIYVAVNEEDVTGDLEITPVTYGDSYPGFEVLYDPPVDFDWGMEICVDIIVQDQAIPPNVMDTFSYCFQTGYSPTDGIPPYTEDWNPEQGDSCVDLSATISVKIKDSGVGVDDSTIIMNVNGENVMDDLLIGAIDHPLSGNYLVTYSPAVGFLISNRLNIVWFYAEDKNGNSVTDTITFMTGPCLIPSWETTITVWSKTGDDTSTRSLYYGVGEDCDNGYDACDIPIFCLPGFPCMYFHIDDPEYPGVFRLQSDMRDGVPGTKFWKIVTETTSENLGAYWDPDHLPEHEFHIATGSGDSPPLAGSWTNMKLYDRISFAPSQVLWIKYSPGFTTGTMPYLQYTEPVGEASGVDVNAPVYIELCEPGSGVDLSSIRVLVNDEDVTDELEFENLTRCSGYSLLYEHPEVPFTLYSDVCVNVIASNLGEPPNELDTTFCFVVFPIHNWSATLTIHEETGEDELLYTLTFGVAEEGNIGCDPYDCYMPMCPPTGYCVYFDLDDPECIFDKLTTDIRSRHVLSHLWEIHQAGAEVENNYYITWNSSEMLPDEDDWHFYIAAVYPGAIDTTWVNMKVNHSLDFLPGQQTLIKNYFDYCCEIPNLCGTVILEGETDYSGTEVYLMTMIGDTLTSEITNETGVFCFLDNLPSTYNVCFHHDNYDDSCLEVELHESTDIGEVMLTLTCYSLSGYVDVPTLEDDGGVLITFSSLIHTEITSTNEDGYYEFECLHADEYSVELYLEGYPIVHGMVTISCDTSDVNWIMECCCLFMEGYATLDGMPAAGINVEILGVGIYETDEHGYFSDSCIYPGEYTFQASYECYDTLQRVVEFIDSPVVYLALSPSLVTISGEATLLDEEDYAGILVCLDGTCITTGSDGEFEFTSLECGVEHVLTASKECYRSIVETLEVVSDHVHDLELEPLPCIVNLVAITDTLERPLLGDSLCINIYWIEPPECCDSIAVLYIPGVEFSDYILDWEIATVISCGSGLGDVGLAFCGVEPDVEYCFTLVPYCEGEHCPWVNEYVCAAASTNPDPNELLIYDYDNGDTPIEGLGVEEAMSGILDMLCITYTTTYQDADLTDYKLEDYDAVFIALGNRYGASSNIPEASLEILIEYLEDRYPVYIEGPDFAADYSSGTPTETEFFDMFHIAFVNDGMSESADTFNVDLLYTSSFSWWSGRYFLIDYANGTPADHYVDEIASDGAWIILEDEEGKGVASYIVSGYQAIYSACYAGAMDVLDVEMGTARIYDEYLRKFGVEIPCPGVTEKRFVKVPEAYDLKQNFPNPFNPTTTIEFAIPDNTEINVAIFNIFGEKVAALAEGTRTAGVYQVTWDGMDVNDEQLPSGVYFCKLQTAGFSKTIKMMFMK